jgi:hypothetical protein
MRIPVFLCCLIVVAATTARADYQDDTGFIQLKAELGPALPDGTGVGLTHVEAKLPSPPFAADAYLPQAGSGTFSGVGRYTGKLFAAKSGAGAFSFHADEVASYYYGNSTGIDTFRHSMCPLASEVDCYSAGVWEDEFLAPDSGQEPIIETRAVQCHPWIYSAGTSDVVAVRDLVRRQDFSINRDNYVCCVGLNNGATTEVPDMWGASYNAISAGLTNGGHSRGGTTPDMDGGGRRKPEIVVPLIATSYAAGYVASAAGMLRQRADVFDTTGARHTKTLKAVLLAGATKDEFPEWSRTAAHPIDAVFGAGELNIYNSYHILDGGEQPANLAAGRPHRAWDYHTLSASGTADYRLNIPAGQYGVELSVFLVWHRTLTDSNNSPSIFSLSPDPLINFDLTLFRDPAAGGAPVTIDSSASTLYNMEHIWKKDLPAGSYRIRVSRGSGVAHDYSIAWRLTAAPHEPQPVITPVADNFEFLFPGLITGQPYKFQTSVNMVNWSDIESFTATGPLATRVLPKPAEPRRLYRLLPVLP